MAEKEIHAVIINKKNLAEPNGSIVIVSPDDFGWKIREYRLPFQKLNYLWTAILGGAGNQIEWREYLIDALDLPESTVFKTDTSKIDSELLPLHVKFLESLVTKFKSDNNLLKKFVYGDSYILSTDLSNGYPENPIEYEDDDIYVYGHWE